MLGSVPAQMELRQHPSRGAHISSSRIRAVRLCASRVGRPTPSTRCRCRRTVCAARCTSQISLGWLAPGHTRQPVEKRIRFVVLRCCCWYWYCVGRGCTSTLVVDAEVSVVVPLSCAPPCVLTGLPACLSQTLLRACVVSSFARQSTSDVKEVSSSLIRTTKVVLVVAAIGACCVR
jgi:hypothetical protein